MVWRRWAWIAPFSASIPLTSARRWGWVISENAWSVATGKHMGQNLPRKDLVPRTPYATFEKMLKVVEDAIEVGEFDMIVASLEAVKAAEPVEVS